MTTLTRATYIVGVFIKRFEFNFFVFGVFINRFEFNFFCFNLVVSTHLISANSPVFICHFNMSTVH